MDNDVAVEIMARITRTLNRVIQEVGEIAPNNRGLWKNILHQMDNDIWMLIIKCVEQLDNEQPLLIKPHQRTAFKDARELIETYNLYYDHVLDVKTDTLNGKRIAWSCLMCVREIINECWNQQIINPRTN